LATLDLTYVESYRLRVSSHIKAMEHVKTGYLPYAGISPLKLSLSEEGSHDQGTWSGQGNEGCRQKQLAGKGTGDWLPDIAGARFTWLGCAHNQELQVERSRRGPQNPLPG